MKALACEADERKYTDDQYFARDLEISLDSKLIFQV